MLPLDPLEKSVTEEQYRLRKLIPLGVLVLGALAIGWRIAENGRYVQYDRQKDYTVIGSSSTRYQGQLIDTRSGLVLPLRDG